MGTFSGGEQTQINAALRFAVSKLCFRSQFQRTPLPVCGRGRLGLLDADDARRSFVNVLLDLGRDYKQMVLITHFPRLQKCLKGNTT